MYTQQITDPRYWLLAIAATLVTLHLGLLSQADDSDLLGISILCWLAITSLICDKLDTLELKSNLFSSLLGISAIAYVLLRSLSPAGYHLRICPLISLIGLCLLASGIKELRNYWKELLALSLLIFISVLSILLKSINLPIITTQFSTFLLWITGSDAVREGVMIILPTGRVEVYGACSGIESIVQMFSIAVLFCLIIPLQKIAQIICLIIAIGLGFIVNAARVALMAVLVASSQLEAFEYWHGGDGSLIFSAIAVFLFAIFCWLAFMRNNPVMSEFEVAND